MKRQTSLRLSRRTDRQITELTQELGCTMAELVGRAIDRMWRERPREAAHAAYARYVAIKSDGSSSDQEHCATRQRMLDAYKQYVVAESDEEL